MSECVFTLGQVLTVFWIDKVLSAPPADQRRHAIIAGVLAGATLLVRTAGAATALGAGLYLLHRRAMRPLVAFSLTTILCLTPWMIYSMTNAPSRAEIAAHGGTIAYPYRELLAQNRPGDPSVGHADATGLVRRLGSNALNILGRDVGGVVLPVILRGANESGEEVVSLGGNTGFMGSMGSSPVTVVLTLGFSVILAIGFFVVVMGGATAAEFVTPVTLLMLLLVPARTFRYVLPLAPFLFFYFVEGVRRLSRNPAVVRMALLVVVGFQLLDHAQYVIAKQTNPESLDWIGDASAHAGLLAWMNANLPPGAVASTNPGLVYLLTGRKAVGTDDYARAWERWKASGIRYIVALRPMPKPMSSLGYRVVYESPTRDYWVLDFGGS